MSSSGLIEAVADDGQPLLIQPSGYNFFGLKLNNVIIMSGGTCGVLNRGIYLITLSVLQCDTVGGLVERSTALLCHAVYV